VPKGASSTTEQSRAIGYCAGGQFAYLAATRLDADVAVAFHGTHIHSHLAEAHRIRGRLSLHYGGRDPLVPMAGVAQVQAAFTGNAAVDIHVCKGAAHGFSFAGRPITRAPRRHRVHARPRCWPG
jgi:dienelactone hydrolase